MTKRLIDIDDDLLERAKELLGSRTNKEAVHRALDECVRLGLQRKHFDRLAKKRGVDLHDPKVMKDAWRTGGRTSSTRAR